MTSEDIDYDEGTLEKVRKGLMRSVGSVVNSETVTGMISQMQNEGILFRERAEGPPSASRGDVDYRIETTCDVDGNVLSVRITSESRAVTLSDGYHTMEELYGHRRALTAVLAGAYAAARLVPSHGAWRSKAHHPDDTPMFEGGYFVVGIELDTGTITYHYELKHWNDFAAVPELEHAPRWDGAPPQVSVNRLLEMARLMARHFGPVDNRIGPNFGRPIQDRPQA